MALVRLEAHGVGPFEDLLLDFSDGQGKPHLGPHVLAGVNGSGKTTVLRAIAWLLSEGDRSFPNDHWKHLVNHRSRASAELSFGERSHPISVLWHPDGPQVIRDRMHEMKVRYGESLGKSASEDSTWLLPGGTFQSKERKALLVSAYSPSRALRHLDPNERTRSGFESADAGLSFEQTIRNADVHGWLVDLFSRAAILKQRDESANRQESLLASLNTLLTEITGESVQMDVTVEYELIPLVRFRGQSLNFSQLPDGVRWIVGLVADFLRRLDSPGWGSDLGSRRPAILMVDEIDAHLHPRWQRTILPALKKALPEVQIIVTTHSPFVITSCPGARVHVLEVDEQGRALARPPIDAPIGESINATMKDIFGVSSQFDVQTEQQLNQWNELKRREHIGALSTDETAELARLIEELSQRSEELRSIVGWPTKVPDSVIQALLSR